MVRRADGRGRTGSQAGGVQSKRPDQMASAILSNIQANKRTGNGVWDDKRAYGRTGERTREGQRLGEESEQADGRTDRRNGGQLESKHASALDRRNRLIYL